jgi:thiol:disulfide interchange protein DsbA
MRLKPWLIALLLLPITTSAQNFEEDVHYIALLEQQPVQTGENVEVLELFWYRCPHCFNLEPYLERWLKTKPEYVEYVRLPAVLSENWAFHARAFYTFEALGLTDRLHRPLFDALHKEPRQRILTLEQLADWAASQGVDRQSIIDTFNSFAVDTKLRHARVMTERYEATGVPTMIVDGKYRTSVSMAGGHDELLQLMDFLAAKSLEERQQ